MKRFLTPTELKVFEREYRKSQYKEKFPKFPTKKDWELFYSTPKPSVKKLKKIWKLNTTNGVGFRIFRLWQLETPERKVKIEME